jgi:hypothetical protein
MVRGGDGEITCTQVDAHILGVGGSTSPSNLIERKRRRRRGRKSNPSLHENLTL